MANTKWSQLNHMQIGRFAEYLVKMEMTSYGFDVYTSEVDDHGIDFIAKNKVNEFLEIQVKSARIDRTSYVFATKDKFEVSNENLLMALVLFDECKSPRTYLIPAETWNEENDLFRDRKYDDKKSKPEWGLNISKKNLGMLGPYEIDKIAVKYLK